MFHVKHAFDLWTYTLMANRCRGDRPNRQMHFVVNPYAIAIMGMQTEGSGNQEQATTHRIPYTAFFH